MKNRLLVFIFCMALCLLILPTKVNVYATISTSAKGMVVLEGNTNTILYENNCHEKLPMASTTKLVTAILAIESCENLDEKFVVSDKAVGIEGTSIYLKEGESLSMRELLYGLILASGNDCAVAIAERLGGEDVFVEKMNGFALSLGLQNTHFDNPHGLDSDTHYTSAYDLAVMTSYALNNDFFVELIGTKRMVIEPTGVYQARYLKNKDKLLFTNVNCIGGKTGFTDNAGRCLVNVHEENNMKIISVVFNCQPMFDECQRLTDLAIKEYMMKEFIAPYNFVSNVEIMESEKSEVGVITVKGFLQPILKSEEHMYEVKYDIPTNLTAPIRLNEEVGLVQVLKNNEVIYEDKLITIEGAENNDIKYLIDNILDKWF